MTGTFLYDCDWLHPSQHLKHRTFNGEIISPLMTQAVHVGSSSVDLIAVHGNSVITTICWILYPLQMINQGQGSWREPIPRQSLRQSWTWWLKVVTKSRDCVHLTYFVEVMTSDWDCYESIVHRIDCKLVHIQNNNNILLIHCFLCSPQILKSSGFFIEDFQVNRQPKIYMKSHTMKAIIFMKIVYDTFYFCLPTTECQYCHWKDLCYLGMKESRSSIYSICSHQT